MANAEESTKAGLSRLQDDARPTICSDSLELISNIAEVGLDEILQNEFLKDIPVISSLVSIYKIGNNIHYAHLLKKYACFLDEFNRDSFENGSWNKYKQYFEESNRKRDIEYLLILLERYIEEDKARRLAKIYEAYLIKKLAGTIFVCLQRLWTDFYLETTKCFEKRKLFRRSEAEMQKFFFD